MLNITEYYADCERRNTLRLSLVFYQHKQNLYVLQSNVRRFSLFSDDN